MLNAFLREAVENEKDIRRAEPKKKEGVSEDPVGDPLEPRRGNVFLDRERPDVAHTEGFDVLQFLNLVVAGLQAVVGNRGIEVVNVMQACHDEIQKLQHIEPLGVRKSFRSLGIHLWDENTKKLISFRAMRRIRAARREKEKSHD